jgi:flavin reductase (DIM6/NTAB) family NADH-FMN oxidoreductase RutF
LPRNDQRNLFLNVKFATPTLENRLCWKPAAENGLSMARKRKAQEELDETYASSPKRKAGGKNETQCQNHHGFVPYPTSKVYRLIEPGPVLLVTTGSLVDSTHNVMTIGFHMVIQHDSPPLIGISLGPWDASFAVLKKRRECVLAVPSVQMIDVVVDIGNCSTDDRDESSKWERFGLDTFPAEKVKAPLVGGSNVIANIECVVEDTKMVSKYSMWILQPVKAWINPDKRPGEGGTMVHHRGDGTFVVDGEILDLKNRMVKWKKFQD